MKQLFIVDLENDRCATHDWQVTYWMPDPFCIRYKRVNFQKTVKANEGSPKTDNSTDYPSQAQTRLNRTL